MIRCDGSPVPVSYQPSQIHLSMGKKAPKSLVVIANPLIVLKTLLHIMIVQRTVDGEFGFNLEHSEQNR